MEKFKTLGDVTRRICKLLEDTSAAEKYLEQSDSQFARRAYIRSVFAYMEGTIWLLKQLQLQAILQSKATNYLIEKGAISLADLALLSDVSYDLKDNGEPFEQTKFLTLPKNLKFTVNIFNRSSNSCIDLNAAPLKWDRFKKTLDVRHRITHPKKAAEIDITDHEIQHAKEVCDWFNNISKVCIEAFHKTFRKH